MMQFGGQSVQIQIGQVTKLSGGSVPVNFPQPFQTTPLVFLTPNFPDAITVVDSVQNVSEDGFTIVSTNFSPDYIVYWLAITITVPEG